MIVRLVLEQQKPILVLAVHIYLYPDRAGVDLVGLVEPREPALLPQLLGGYGGDIHEVDGLILPAEFFARVEIRLPLLFAEFALELHPVHGGEEGGVAAVIRPIGVDHPYLGERGIALFGAEIVAAEPDIVGVHSERILRRERRRFVVGKFGETFHRRDFGGHREFGFQRLGQRKRGFTTLDRVDDIPFYALGVLFGDVAVEGVDLRGRDRGTLALRDDLDALRRAVGALIELPGKGLDREHRRRAYGVRLGGCRIELRLRKDVAHRVIEEFFAHAFGVVAVDDANAREPAYAEGLHRVRHERPRLCGEFGLLLHENSVDHITSRPPRRALSRLCRCGDTRP